MMGKRAGNVLSLRYSLTFQRNQEIKMVRLLSVKSASTKGSRFGLKAKVKKREKKAF